MSSSKKEIRRNFRDASFKRDKYKCVMCSFQSSPEKSLEELDCHHIIPRTEMPNGGYVKENGISLCSDCHLKAEEFYSTGVAVPGFSPEELYKRINSSKEKAIEASKRLEHEKR